MCLHNARMETCVGLFSLFNNYENSLVTGRKNAVGICTNAHKYFFVTSS